jgi:hypothetical protein
VVPPLKSKLYKTIATLEVVAPLKPCWRYFVTSGCK